jgi:putative membrane protein
VAATKGTNAEVRSFGKDMMRDHHALRKMGLDLAKKLNVTPAMPAGDNSQAAAAAWHDSLTAMAKGAAFDKAYIDHEVTYHQSVLQTAQSAAGAAQNAELKALIQKAAPNLQAHLERAQKIQAKLGGTAAGGAAGGAMGDTAATKKP